MNRHQYTTLIQTVLHHYPEVQAIYLFGSVGTEDERPESDADIALLLPPHVAKHAGFLALSDAHVALENVLQKPVDLINLRHVSTILQKEVIAAERCIYLADSRAAEEFEMLTLSYYQKLNEERREIIQAVLQGERFYQS